MAGSVEKSSLLSKSTGEERERAGGSDREIIAALPTHKSWKINSLMYQYEGFWYYSGGAVEGVMWMQKHFKPRMEDLLLVSFPRCGTTWLKSLMFAIMNRARYDLSAHPLLTSSPHELVPFLEFCMEQNIPLPDLDGLSSPYLFHTHTAFTSLPKPVRDCQSRIVYICRDPKDVFVSIFCFLSRWNVVVPLEEALELFCNGVCVYGPFWDHVFGYWNANFASPQRVLFMKYEDLKRDCLGQVRKLEEFMGFPFSSEEEDEGLVGEITEFCSFEKLRNLKANKTGAITVGDVSAGTDTFFRKGEVGDWKNHLTAEMANRIDRIVEEKLNGSGLSFCDSSI